MRTLSSFACAAASPRSWKFRKILYSAVALHTQFPLCGMFQKQPICYTEQFRIKKGKFSFSFFVLRRRGVAEHFTRRDSSKAAVFIWRRFSRCNLRITLENAKQTSRGNHPTTVHCEFFFLWRTFFSYLLCLTQHLFLVGHGCNLRGVLSREIKSVISTGKQAFW